MSAEGDGVIGQLRVKALLRRMRFSGQLPHALLFIGPAGTGKDAVAIQLARLLLCDDPSGAESACGVCQSCVAVGQLQHQNLTFVTALPSGKNENGRTDHPLARLTESELSVVREELQRKGEDPYYRMEIPKALQIKISSVRQIRRDLSKGMSGRGPRVVIVSNADQMRKEAANAFLKTLEEPSPHTHIIMTTSSPDRLLPTIQSRCQVIRFDRLDENVIEEALIERMGAPKQQAALAARLAQGSYSQAAAFLGEEFAQERLDILSFLRSTLKRSPSAAYEEIEGMASGSDRPRIERLLTLLLVWLRDVFVLSTTGLETHMVNTDQSGDVRSFLKNFPNAPIDRMIGSVEESIASLRRNAQPTLVLTVLAMRLIDACYQPGHP